MYARTLSSNIRFLNSSVIGSHEFSTEYTVTRKWKLLRSSTLRSSVAYIAESRPKTPFCP